MMDEDDDLAAQADEYLDKAEAEETSVICPKSGQPVVEFEKAWDFPGYPEAFFFKTIAGREMSAEDYVKIIKSGKEGAHFEGFTSKAGKSFAAKLWLNPDHIYEGKPVPGIEFVQPKTLGVICPLSNKPVIDRDKNYSFPGYPELYCGKVIAGRAMKAEEYLQILKEGKLELSGFKSKKTGKAFQAVLKYVKSSTREQYAGKPAIEFDFPARS